MKSLRNKIILSGLVLLFALVATIGSTFAWFTVSNTVTVEALDLNVSTSESLLIRIFNGETGAVASESSEHLRDAAYYFGTVSQADVLLATTAGYDDLPTWVMTPVTAATEVTQFETDYAVINGKILNRMDIDTKDLTQDATANSASGDYIELKFWLYSQTTTEDIVLGNLVVTSDAGNTTPQAAVANAVAVAVFKSQENDTATPAETAKIFAPNPDYGFTFTAGMRGYDGDATDSVETPATLYALHSLFYNGAALANVSVVAAASATTIASVTAATPTLFTVRIYLEGWDAQTTNAILAAAFSISFKFTIKNA